MKYRPTKNNMIKLFEDFEKAYDMSESKVPHDWKNLAPSEILITLTNWVGGVSGDDEDFEAGMQQLGAEMELLTKNQKIQLNDMIAKMQQHHQDK